MRLLLVLLVCLLIVGCTGFPGGSRQGPTDEDLRKGTKGLDVSFFTDTFSNGLQENERFDIVVDVHNDGAYDVLDGVLTIDTESAVIRLLNQKALTFDIVGRGQLNPEGELRTFVFPAQASALRTGSVEHETVIYATACYDYETIFAKDVCVDSDPYNRELSDENKVCTRRDVSGGTQGAPMVVDKVEVKTYLQDDDIYLPQFIVHIKNAKKGLVFLPSNTRDVCTGRAVADDQLNKVYVEASLSDVPMLCGSDNLAVLREGKATITCGLVDAGGGLTPIDSDLAAYMAPLTVKLYYGYSETISEKFSIKRN